MTISAIMRPSFPTLAGWHDVFHEILNALEPIDDDDGDDDDDDDDDDIDYFAARRVFRSTLLSLSISCHAFLDPSLNRLWRDLDGIHSFLSLLPNYQRRDFTYVSGYVYVLRSMCYHLTHIIMGKSLTGDISPDAWTRLQTYATRVRDINVYLAEYLDSSIWSTLLKQCHGQPLFPNLRTLRVGIRWEAVHDGFSPAQSLASPSLRTLIISSNADQRADMATIATITASLLQEFAVKSPGLIRFSFFPFKTVNCEYLTCLSQFAQMEQLVLSSHSILDEDLLMVLTRPTNLTHLGASILLRDPSESGQLDLKDGFQKLTNLSLELHRQPSLPRFFFATSMPRLRDLSIRLRDQLADGFHTSFPSICRHIGPHTLTRLQVELDDFAHPPPFLMELLEPLLPFANLEELELLFEEHLPLRDEDIARFAHAWPKLRVLLFMQSEATVSEPDREPGAVERPTLHGLITLARGCPQLGRLCVPDLDVSALPQADGVPLLAHGPLDLCVQNLVGAEDGERQLDVAVALDRLFPRLKLKFGIEELAGYDNPNPFLEDSENVSRLLRAMQIARRNYPGGV